MGDLARRSANGLSRLDSRAARQLARDVEDARHDGVRAAARIEAAAFATHVALQHVGGLSSTEGQLIKQVPLGEGRYQTLVDNFTLVASGELLMMQRRW